MSTAVAPHGHPVVEQGTISNLIGSSLIETDAWSWVDSDEFAAFWQVFIIYFGLIQSALCYKSLEWFKAYLDTRVVEIPAE